MEIRKLEGTIAIQSAGKARLSAVHWPLSVAGGRERHEMCRR